MGENDMEFWVIHFITIFSHEFHVWISVHKHNFSYTKAFQSHFDIQGKKVERLAWNE